MPTIPTSPRSTTHATLDGDGVLRIHPGAERLHRATSGLVRRTAADEHRVVLIVGVDGYQPADDAALTDCLADPRRLLAGLVTLRSV